MSKIARFADGLIGLFSPKREAQRLYYRHRIAISRQLKKRYAAAKTTRQTGAWSPVSQNINEILGDANAAIRARARQLVRDFPYFRRAVQVIVDYTVGMGLEFQPRVKKLDGSLNKSLNQKIEDAWNWWADEADFAGKLHLYEMMRLAKRQDLECGEFIFVKATKNDPGRYLPLALQMYEADWLTDFMVKPEGTNRVEMGVEYKSGSGEVVAYHFTDPDSWGKTVRIPQERVIHRFETLRPGQLRGVSPFAPAILVAHDLSDYMDAEIDAAKMAARYLAFIETPDIPTYQAQRVSTPETTTDTVERIDEMETAVIEYLNPGEKVTISHHERGGPAFEAFSSFVLRMIAITLDIPYELLSGDYAALDYSSLRGVRNDMQKHFVPLQARHTSHFCMPCQRWFMDEAVLEGKLALPGYFDQPWPYLKAHWQPPGLEAIDPLREGKADIDRIDKLLMSPQEHAARRGRNYEDILDEIEEARRMQADRKLSPAEKTSTALASNPAAVGK